MVDRNPETVQALDELKYRNNSAIKKVLASDEYVLLSSKLYKYNKRLKRQERDFLLTNKAIYNINKDDLLAKFASIFSNNSIVKRKIDLQKIGGITISEISSEFVVHIPTEYDYRFSSPDKRERIIENIAHAYYLNVKNNPLKFFFKDDVNLIEVTTTEDDMKKGVSRFPKQGGTIMSEQEIKDRFEEQQKKKAEVKASTETVFKKTNGNLTNQGGITINDFEILKVLGRGAFGKVMLVEKKDTKQIFAIKSIHKEAIIEKDQLEHTKTERYILEKVNSPFLVGLEYAFKTNQKIYFVMNFMRGGELFQHLRNSKRFDEKRAKFYAAEILLGIEHLHSMGAIYRDLKPENVLMDENGHVSLTDFGMAKILKDGQKAFSFVGTPEYLAPEIIEGKGHTFPADWWALGILIFEMMIGIPPFYNREQNTQKMFQAIRERSINFGTKVPMSENAKDLILKLLNKNADARLGTNGADDIKKHPWFKDIDWDLLSQKKVNPPFKPKVRSEFDTDNFDEEFTSEEAYDSYMPDSNMKLLNKHDKDFEDFTYVPKNDKLGQ